jgi:magnesium-protoporphyrin IX monomethyl ester (oxidative) cyclase
VKIIDSFAEGHNIVTRVPTHYGSINRVGLPYEEIVNRIPPDTDLIGITGPFSHEAQIIAELSSVIKKAYPNKHIVLGGFYPSALPERALTQDVDYIIVGEGEIPMLQLAEGMDPSQIQGLIYRDDRGEAVKTGKSLVVDNLDDLPFPARHLLPMDKYLKISSRGWRDLRCISVYTSRGCPYDCQFCSTHNVYSRRWRAASPEYVLREIEHCVKEYNVEHIEFEDDNLTLDKERAVAIFDGLKDLSKRLGRKILWSASNGLRVDSLDEQLLIKMKESGCYTATLAIEHGDPAILEKMNKKLDLSKVEEVVRISGKLKLNTQVFYMIGYPGETKESFMKSLRYAQHIRKIGKVGKFWVYTTNPNAGSQLAQYCREHGYLANPESSEIDTRHLDRDYGGIVTEDFDTEEVKRRRRYMERKLNSLWLTVALRYQAIILKLMPDKLIRLLQRIQRKFGW